MMNGKRFTQLILAGVVVLGLAWFAWAQSNTGTAAKETPAADTGGTTMGYGGMMMGNGGMMSGHNGMMTGSQTTTGPQASTGHEATGWDGMILNTDQMWDMMKRMHMSPDMGMWDSTMMRTTITKDDPTAILAMKDQLGLTTDQVAKLKEILRRARNDADNVLTQKQHEEIAKLPEHPNTLGHMMGYMRHSMHNLGMTQNEQTQSMYGLMGAMMHGNWGSMMHGYSNTTAQANTGGPTNGNSHSMVHGNSSGMTMHGNQ